MSYNKRNKGGWNQGKACKGSRKGRERVYVRQDIEQQLAEQDPNFRYRKYKRTPNKIMQLEHRIKWCEQVIASQRTSGSRFKNFARDWKQKTEKQLKKLKEKENAVRPQQQD